ncbi:hypothetical protein SEA_DIMINIMUS_127 [Mycobacterium phage Diminimus]|nr:hypothetical protein [Mycobacterium phage SirSheldon]WNN95686.1 hypothetical protein SEA_GLASKE16_129 [Mycobacterium phage Glaske16]WNN96258.1 hypothetical protein SEA_DULCITA_127 [Mycobacterium phage Dulcita]WNO28202.1 hypothetical protein SEA_DIMINIMUS_127 [Mycobacterium phage Diminimus]
MTEFFTVIAVVNGRATSDTDASTNSHRSVRSYKTEKIAQKAIRSAVQEPGVTYRILHTVIEDGWEPVSTWTDFVWRA